MTSRKDEAAPPAYATPRLPVEAPPIFIDDDRTLEERCRRWGAAEALGVDTEFVRERTFYPALGLIQISDGRENALVDPLRLTRLDPLRRLFADQRIVKVFHSCGEDLEVLHQQFGELPSPIFDTQVAAAFVGLGFSVGLGNLIRTLFEVDLPEAATRTNWLRRPLTASQKEYAAFDVAYLLPIYDVLRDRLRASGREAWAEEELAALGDTERFDTDLDEAYFKLRRSRGLDRRQLGVLRELAVWREKEARSRNLPRNFVLRQAMLPELARRVPRSLRDLRQVRGLKPEESRRHGRALLHTIRGALELPEEELPEPPSRLADLTPFRREIGRMREAVAETAAQLDLPAELLATRRTVEGLVRRVVTGREPPLPKELRGWRRRVIGDRLLELAAPLAGAAT